jgi:flagellar biogenesis protein FliO
VALLTFNLGVELGQLAVVALVGLLWWGLMRLQQRVPAGEAPVARVGALERVRVAALYAVGGLAAFWTIERSLAIFA